MKKKRDRWPEPQPTPLHNAVPTADDRLAIVKDRLRAIKHHMGRVNHLLGEIESVMPGAVGITVEAQPVPEAHRVR